MGDDAAAETKWPLSGIAVDLCLRKAIKAATQERESKREWEHEGGKKRDLHCTSTDVINNREATSESKHSTNAHSIFVIRVPRW